MKVKKLKLYTKTLFQKKTISLAQEDQLKINLMIMVEIFL